MRFNETLRYNAVPQWISYYIDYSGLKRVIYSLEKVSVLRMQQQQQSTDKNSSKQDFNPVTTYRRRLDSELEKINSFYIQTEEALFKGLNKFLGDSKSFQTKLAEFAEFEADLEAQSSHEDTVTALRLRATNIYVSLCELRSFLQLNRTGFSKALKKFDKTLNTNLRCSYMTNVAHSYIFKPETEDNLAESINKVVNSYALLVTRGNTSSAMEQLQAYLRESVIFDRNTVWRDQMTLNTATLKTDGLQGQVDAEEKMRYIRVMGITFKSSFFNIEAIKFALIAIIFFAILTVPILESEPQNRCLAVVVAASLFWATETMPPFVTSLMLPFLIVVLRIPCNPDGSQMRAPQASAFLFSSMWSPVIQLLLGGFTLASALSKYNIAKMLATKILASAGTNPKVILLTFMFLATFLSMWISNVAAPVLCYSIAQSVLRTLPNGDPFGTSIVLGIALASNIGGMASPIASPQNIIALENMSPAPSWVQWFAVALPVSILSNLAIWSLLIMTLKPGKNVKKISPVRAVDEKFGPTQWFISFVTILTIVLWCVSHQLEPYVGDTGILALIPIVIFFGTKLLATEDFNGFLWTIIALAMGGSVLGKAVSTSGLLATVAHGIEQHVIRGMGVFGVMAVFGFLILVLATFISHTVAALIILPLIKSVAERMEDSHPRLLVMGAALLCSAAMGFPTSGFPNVTAICMHDEFGRPYLTGKSFISRGVPASILAYALIVTVGYLILHSMGF